MQAMRSAGIVLAILCGVSCSPSRSGRALQAMEALSNILLAQILSWPHFGAAAYQR